MTLHRTLARQLERVGAATGEAPSGEAWTRLLEVVSAAYDDADTDRHLLERAIGASAPAWGAQDELSAKARQDALTGLPNRAGLLERLAAELAQARHDGTLAALLFMDLDGLAAVGGALGRDAGDDLLIRAGRRIRECVRGADLVARLDGDAFVVLCPRVGDEQQALGAAHRIVETLQRPFRTAGEKAFVSATVGVAVTDGREASPEDFLRRAELAMNEARRSGRSRFLVLDAGMQRRAAERLALENELRRAVELDELVLHFQPVVSLSTGRALALEALVRWERPGRGLVAPDAFMAAAERSRLIVPIGRWVLANACRAAAQWPDPAPAVSVNLSAPELAHGGVVDAVATALADAGLAPQRLIVELTASPAADEPAVAANLARLRALGVQIALDDFGTGSCSLSHARTVPAQVLKLDAALVAGIDEDPSAAAVVGAAVTLGRALGRLVVAEGVERPAQAYALAALGCEAAQGFHFARPCAAAELDPAWTGASPDACRAA